MDSTDLRIVFLASGSSGNATAVSDGVTTVLIDCGLSAREIARRMAAAGLDADDVAAILVTHEHGDHVRGVDVFARRHHCAVYATSGTARRAGAVVATQLTSEIAGGETLTIGTLEVLPFQTAHDCAEPVSYRIASRSDCIGVMSDTGHLTPHALEALKGCSVLGIESNHDLHMLEVGPYPSFLKRRIRSANGHLSNEDAAGAVEALAHDGLRLVVGVHRSRTNNTERLALDSLTARVKGIGLDGVEVRIASQDEILDTSPAQGSLFGRAL